MSERGPRIGFLGAGRMATAMARAWTRTGWLDPANILASDVLSTARTDFARETDCR
ncbi:MAG: NAD(P)-binding domain-containing protein, partial [Gemmataceae bacterium]